MYLVHFDVHKRQTAVTLFPACFQIQNGEQKGYILKNKELTGLSKGIIYLEMEVIYNTVSSS